MCVVMEINSKNNENNCINEHLHVEVREVVILVEDVHCLFHGGNKTSSFYVSAQQVKGGLDRVRRGASHVAWTLNQVHKPSVHDGQKKKSIDKRVQGHCPP